MTRKKIMRSKFSAFYMNFAARNKQLLKDPRYPSYLRKLIFRSIIIILKSSRKNIPVEELNSGSKAHRLDFKFDPFYLCR